jgi:WhiB family redox-sensing transcriptional regulator
VAPPAYLIQAGTVGAAPLGQVHTPATLEELVRRPAWMRDAACLEHPEVSFFLARGEDSQPAKRVCRDCLVRERCLAFALADVTIQGIWGGTSNGERRQLRAGRAAVAKASQGPANPQRGFNTPAIGR